MESSYQRQVLLTEETVAKSVWYYTHLDFLQDKCSDVLYRDPSPTINIPLPVAPEPPLSPGEVPLSSGRAPPDPSGKGSRPPSTPLEVNRPSVTPQFP